MAESLGEGEGRGECSLRERIPAYIQDELTAGERAELEAHIRKCPLCDEELREVGEVLGELERLEVDSGEVDLLPGVLARVEEEKGRRRPLPLRLALVTAGAAAALVLAVTFHRAILSPPARDGTPREAGPVAIQGPGETTAAPQSADAQAAKLARDWLVAAQEPSGVWSAARWGGRPVYDVALTGLAVLALLGGDDDPRLVTQRGAPEAALGPVLSRAVEYLLGEQGPDGLLGPRSEAALYNHSLATMGLLEAYGATGAERLREPIDGALRFVQTSGMPGGGWGYLGDPAAGANTAATCWPLQALLLARALGWDGLDEAIRGGFRHLERVADERGWLGYRQSGEFLYGPETLTAMGAFCVLLGADDPAASVALRRRILDGLERAHAARPPMRGRWHLISTGPSSSAPPWWPRGGSSTPHGLVGPGSTSSPGRSSTGIAGGAGTPTIPGPPPEGASTRPPWQR